MATLLRMPGVSADSDEAVLIEWAVAEGEAVGSSEMVAIVETEKANVDIAAGEGVILFKTLAEPGKTVSVGDPIAVLLAPGEDGSAGEELLRSLGSVTVATELTAGAEAFDSTPVGASAREPHSPEDSSVKVPRSSEAPWLATEAAAADGSGNQPCSHRIFATPIARRIARENGLGVENISGSGPNGRIRRADVEAALALRRDEAGRTPSSSEAADSATSLLATAFEGQIAGVTEVPHSGLRRTVAARLSASKREAPHFYLTAQCRVDALLDLRQAVNSDATTRVSINDFFVAAVAKALVAVPEMNVTWGDEAVRHYDAVDVAVAIASERGLVAPVVRDADTLNLSALSHAVKDLAERASAGTLKKHELEGGTFTVTNLGMFGVETFSAIINPPQVAILAVGAVVKRPIVVDDSLEIGRTITVALSVDHRPVDGVLAARWLQSFITLIENPLRILT